MFRILRPGSRRRPISIPVPKSPSAQTITLTGGIASAESFGTATITRGAVNIAPTGIATAQALGTPVLSLNITVSGVASQEAFGSITVYTTKNLSPSSISSGETFSSAEYLNYFPFEDLFTGSDNDPWSAVLWITETV